MKRYHPIVAIIFGIILSVILGFILPIILTFFGLILGGFTATYLSKTNKAILGFYVGLVISIIVFLPSLFISNNFSSYALITLVLIPFLGFLGGFIAKKLRLRSYAEDELDNNKGIKWNIYIVSIILGIFFVVLGLLEMLILGLSISIVTALLGIMFVVGGVFTRKGYRNKTFYLFMFSILALIGLISVYGFLVKPADIFDNYLSLGVFILFLFLYSRTYLLRHKAVKLPWKDEW
jgi:hypothetical protein